MAVSPELNASLLRATLDATADGILVVDLAGRVIVFNDRFLSMWRIPPSLATAQLEEPLLDWSQQQLEDPVDFLHSVRELYRSERDSFDVLRFKDGRVFERCSRPQRLGGEMVGRVWSFHDVTKTEHLLRKARDAVRARDEILSTTAHEIRGPITSIRLATQTLRELDSLDPTTSSMLGLIDRADQRLSRFVDELIDVGGLRSGVMAFEFEEVDLREVIQEVCVRFDPDMKRSGSELTVQMRGDLVGEWDRLRVDQIVSNLLSNAIKFGQGRPIRIIADEADGVATIAVRDHGRGIPSHLHEVVFLPFERAAASRQFGGLGLGLYIVKAITVQLGGQVTIDSMEGAGTTLTVSLPRRRAR